MTNKILIDGWNVCWKIPEISALIPQSLEHARNKFNQIVKSYFSNKKVQYKIIYDGQPDIIDDEYQQNKYNIYFSKNPESADSLIIDFLKKQNDRKKWTIITSDHELSKKVKAFDAKVLSSEEFINKVKKITNKNSESAFKESPHLNNDDIKFWLELFTMDKNNK